ncbi:ABC transporter permease [Rhodobacteraceae bacterium HSP-20]|uniref:ABC transporter permease n=1 Tax=Paragemmobacter amnigenus TaxID=2852097 RepID=A0ABS6J4D6_9RHOB|nr:ABC transporter permease [Rhodobacter amnigenus]MBU9698615.1 ABC transporter permease [Rhodobacter amnigenus]MBV4389842.1 ABC transporter permease [Rhodobacter amnigenus]
MQDLLRRYGAGLTTIICLLVFFWLAILVVIPNITLFESSFRPYLPVTEVGGPKDVYSFDNYLKVFGGEVEVSPLGFTFLIPVHVLTFFLTMWYSVVVTVLCFAIAYPMAYYMSKIANPRSVPTLVLLIFVPLWVSEVLRAFAWWIILAFKGPLNSLLLALGLIEAPVRWITDYDAVVIGLIYTYVLFMLFPVYNAISSLDTNQIEAAEDLGAPWWKIHWRIVLPHAKPGVASGSVMVFMLSAGSLLVPSILGSTTSQWFTQTINQWFNDALDWNTASAYAFLLLFLCTVFVALAMWAFKVKLSDIAK